jgi:hypothetical protein
MSTAAWTISVIAILIVVLLAIRWELSARRAARTKGEPPRSLDERPKASYEFMSVEWIAMAKTEITEALSGSDLDVPTFTLSEEFTDPPRHLRRGDDTIGFSVRVGNGRVEVGDQPEPDADLRVISDYTDALVIARDPGAAAADPAEAERRVAEGRLRVEGDASRMPESLQGLDIHRLLAARTA